MESRQRSVASATSAARFYVAEATFDVILYLISTDVVGATLLYFTQNKVGRVESAK